ncbi:MAG: hypothetical protein FWE45_04035 [Firmicutes bacterium]|nr:hypothetical protein [Bacillota bacterium]
MQNNNELLKEVMKLGAEFMHSTYIQDPLEAQHEAGFEDIIRDGIVQEDEYCCEKQCEQIGFSVGFDAKKIEPKKRQLIMDENGFVKKDGIYGDKNVLDVHEIMETVGRERMFKEVKNELLEEMGI